MFRTVYPRGFKVLFCGLEISLEKIILLKNRLLVNYLCLYTFYLNIVNCRTLRAKSWVALLQSLLISHYLNLMVHVF